MLSRGEDANQVNGWPHAIELTQRAIASGKRADVSEAAQQIYRSLFLSMEIDISAKKQPAPSKRSHVARPARDHRRA